MDTGTEEQIPPSKLHMDHRTSLGEERRQKLWTPSRTKPKTEEKTKKIGLDDEKEKRKKEKRNRLLRFG